MNVLIDLYNETPKWMWLMFGLSGGYLICLADVWNQARKEDYVVVIKERRRR